MSLEVSARHTALELAVATDGIAANAVVSQAEAYFAFLSGNDAATEPAAPAAAAPKAGKGKKATESAPPAATQPQAAPAPAAQPAPSQAAPTISKDKLNKAVTNYAGVDRDAAIALLGKFGVRSTATLDPAKYQEVFDAFEEAQAAHDAKASQVSLV